MKPEPFLNGVPARKDGLPEMPRHTNTHISGNGCRHVAVLAGLAQAWFMPWLFRRWRYLSSLVVAVTSTRNLPAPRRNRIAAEVIATAARTSRHGHPVRSRPMWVTL